MNAVYQKAAKPIDAVRLILREGKQKCAAMKALRHLLTCSLCRFPPDDQVQFKVLVPESIANQLHEYNDQKLKNIQQKTKAEIELSDTPHPSYPNTVWCLFRGTIFHPSNAM